MSYEGHSGISCSLLHSLRERERSMYVRLDSLPGTASGSSSDHELLHVMGERELREQGDLTLRPRRKVIQPMAKPGDE